MSSESLPAFDRCSGARVRFAVVCAWLAVGSLGMVRAQQGAPLAAPAASIVRVNGCVIDADHYAPIGVPVSAYALDGVLIGTATSTQGGRFSLEVPSNTRIYLMTPAGSRSVHSTSTVQTQAQDMEMQGCLLHLN